VYIVLDGYLKPQNEITHTVQTEQTPSDADLRPVAIDNKRTALWRPALLLCEYEPHPAIQTQWLNRKRFHL